jgi:hypothetical protein
LSRDFVPDHRFAQVGKDAKADGRLLGFLYSGNTMGPAFHLEIPTT